MTPVQVQMVRDTWQQVIPIADTAADLFYNRLFYLDPTLKPLFPSDLSAQKKKLVHAITMVVSSLTNWDKVVPALREMGKRHTSYGTKPEHYAVVGEALLWTLEQGLAKAFTPEVKQSWIEAYTMIADVMKQAAAEAA